MTKAGPRKVSYSEGDEKQVLVLIKMSGFFTASPVIQQQQTLNPGLTASLTFLRSENLVFHQNTRDISLNSKWGRAYSTRSTLSARSWNGPFRLSFSPSELTSLPAPWQYLGVSCLLRLITVPLLFLRLNISAPHQMFDSLMNEIPFHHYATAAQAQNSICCLACANSYMNWNHLSLTLSISLSFFLSLPFFSESHMKDR